MLERERVEDRVLGAIRLVDAVTGQDIDRRLEVAGADGVEVALIRNLSGLYVIRDWEPLRQHRLEFEIPPPDPAVGSQTLRLCVMDPLGQYLPRALSIALPRNASAVAALQSDSLFQPIRAEMFPSPSASSAMNWCRLRVSVRELNSDDAIGGALLQVVRNEEVLASGMSDWRGEAFVPVVGIPVQSFSEDDTAIVVQEIDADLELRFDPAEGLRTPRVDVDHGRRPARVVAADPDVLAEQVPTVFSVSIAAGRAQHLAVSVDLS